ncbi:hypothetical protein M2422_004685 [Enterobacter sp. SLBN-59]|nr:hypothetical protein [Enterobacter sp. SLBN-59]
MVIFWAPGGNNILVFNIDRQKVLSVQSNGDLY